MNGVREYFSRKYSEFSNIMAVCDYVISVEEHTDYIIKIIKELVDESKKVKGHTPLMVQFKLSASTEYKAALKDLIDNLCEYDLVENPTLQFFKADKSELGDVTLKNVD